MQSLLDRRVDGIIHVPVDPKLAVPRSLPVVQLNRHSMPLQADAFVADDGFGIGELTNLALNAGHTDIAFVTGGPIHSTSVERLAAFQTSVLANGLIENADAAPRFRVLASEFTSNWGREAMHTLHADPPTVVVAASSRIALGILHACRDLDVLVPDQLSLVAHGNPEWYEAFTPGITCYAPPLAEIGRAAATAILSRIADDAQAPPESVENTPTVTRLHGAIHVRGSLGGPSPRSGVTKNSA
jgi:LacI family transcriptional regulator